MVPCDEAVAVARHEDELEICTGNKCEVDGQREYECYGVGGSHIFSTENQRCRVTEGCNGNYRDNCDNTFVSDNLADFFGSGIGNHFRKEGRIYRVKKKFGNLYDLHCEVVYGYVTHSEPCTDDGGQQFLLYTPRYGSDEKWQRLFVVLLDISEFYGYRSDTLCEYMNTTHKTILNAAPENTGTPAIPCAIATEKGFIHDVPKPICVAT